MTAAYPSRGCRGSAPHRPAPIGKQVLGRHRWWPAPRLGQLARQQKAPLGFTLLEVLLALGLTLVVLMAVGMAVDFFIRGVETSRAAVEEAQLARALLNRIADDLRSAVRYDPVNAEQLVSLGTLGSGLSSAGMPGGTSSGDADSDTGSGQEVPFGLASGDSSATGSGASAASLDTSSTAPRSLPGLYGTRTELQVDVSRLPRLDQYDYELLAVADSPVVVDRLSDVKTVTYYVLDALEGETSLGQPRRGWVRAELDRAVTAYAAETGALDPALEFEPIAPEVAAVEFEYFDGQQWYDTWDSQEQQGLPVAVRVTLYFYPAELRRGGWAWLDTSAAYANSENFVAYSLLVRLPGSEPATGLAGFGTSEISTSQSQAEGATSGSSGGPSAGGGTGGTGGGGGSGGPGGGGPGGGAPGGGGPGGPSGGRSTPGTFNPFGNTTSGGGTFGGKSR